MTTSRIFRVVSLIGLMALTAATQALPVLGCNAASRTNVDCADIFGGTQTELGVNFYTASEYHVGYRRGIDASPDFMDHSLSVSRHDAFATSVSELARAEQGSGSTMVIEFDSGAVLSGMVLSGLSQVSSDPRDPNADQNTEMLTEMAQVTAFNAEGEKVFDQLVEGRNGYVYVNFGDIVPQISTLLISSGGGLPGLTSTNTNIAYFITQLPEPSSFWLIVTGLGALALRRRFR